MRPRVVLVVLALAGIPLGCETAHAATTPVSRWTPTTPAPMPVVTVDLGNPIGVGADPGQPDAECGGRHVGLPGQTCRVPRKSPSLNQRAL
jgi:hypothetical protein